MTLVSSENTDWSHKANAPKEWNPGKSSLTSIRTYQKCRDGLQPLSFIRKRQAVLIYRFLIQASAPSALGIPAVIHEGKT